MKNRFEKIRHTGFTPSALNMWARVWLAWLAVSVCSCAWAQQTSTKVQQGGSSFEWGWHQGPQGPATVGHYYIKLPQSEQRVNYEAVNTSDRQHAQANGFSVGHALEINHQLPDQSYQVNQGANGTSQPQQQPLEIFLLQQQYNPPLDQEFFQVQPTAIPANLIQYSPTPYFYVTNNPQLYNVQQNNPPQVHNGQYKSDERAERSRPLAKEDTTEQEHEVLTTSVVKVFKDHNCSHDNTTDLDTKESVNEAQKPNKLSTQESRYELRNINGNYGVKDTTPRTLSYRGAVHFRVESPRENARSERYYYTTIATPTNNNEYYNKNDGITKLVVSTQDLISNEDLLRINHAAEKQVHIQTDDLIKPRSRFNLRGEQTRYSSNYNAPRSKITVKAKYGNIVDSSIEHVESNDRKEQINSNEYRFVTPIVVAEPSGHNFKEQLLNNLVSTMVPYIEDGYEIVSVRNSLDEKNKHERENQDNNYDPVDVTPRPIGQKYLAPITVALRLLNANDTETLNSVEDHETSDSEPIPNRVERPRKEKTIVEIQESIPVSITHINDVEVHEYLDEGRSNDKGPFDMAKSLFNRYVEALANSKKIQKNIDDNQYKYRTSNDYDNINNNDERNDNSEDENNAEENLDQSENIQLQVQVRPHDDSSNERSELANYYNEYDNKKIIQPIIIEKQVPITQFVDRFIEKQVPYPEPFEVVKTVQVDRPVPYPVAYEKVVEKPVEVTRFVDKPYPVEIHHPYPIGVPYPVEQKVYVDRPVHVPYPVEKVVEKQVIQTVPVPTPVAVPVEVPVPVEKKVLYPVPVQTPVAVPVEVEKPVPVERIVHKEVPVPYPVEKRVPYPVPYETRVPVPYPVEKRVPYPVEKIVEKPVTVTKYVDKPVHIQVPVPHPVPVAVHVREPYPVDRIVEKKVPYPVPVDRIVEKKVHVKVPYPVQTVVEKIVEKPVVVTKYVDKPYPVEKRVPYPVEKIVEKKVPYPVQVPYEVKVPYPVERIVEKPVHIRVPYPVEKIVEKPFAVYSYGYGHNTQQQQQSQTAPQYVKHNFDQQKQSSQNQAQKNVLHPQIQYLRDRLKQPVQSTQWGNQYASSYQYVNTTQQGNDYKRSLVDYINYMTNAPSNNYYGPPPLKNYDDWWQNNKDYVDVVEMKVRRTDRTPKVTKLRIEYGGFKPPLIPSTEVDLDGLPVKKGDAQS